MKTPFVQPRFTGSRFDEHSLPVDVAKDLAAYQDLVVQLAKHLYLKDHPERQRVPKGFESSFELHLEKVDGGSAKPLLTAVASALTLDLGATSYFTQARDLITQCIASDAPPADFPRELLAYFNVVGRSLQEGEAMELPDTRSGSPAVLTPERRRALVLSADKVYDKQVELMGFIGEVDFENKTFRLRFNDGSSKNVPYHDAFENKARKYAGSSRHQVTVRCVAAFDSWDRLQKVIEVESIDMQPNYEVAQKFEGLAALEDGWFDGDGKAPPKDALREFTGMMVRHYPVTLKLPAIVPTPEGGILLEWRQPGTPSVDLDLANRVAEFHQLLPSGGDQEVTFALKNDPDWEAFIAFLNERIDPQQS